MISHSLTWFALLAGPLVQAPAANQDSVDRTPRQRIEQLIPTLLEKHAVPGASVAVFRDGELDWAAGFGVLEQGTERVVTTTSRFQAASISKPVAAFAALRLVERGDLELDADVHEFLLAWEVPRHEFSEGVTLRRLLCHGAGLTVHGFPGYDSRGEVASLLQVLDGTGLANTPPIFVDIEPGSQARYSGGGYCVLQQLMIDVSGQPFPELMQDLVLGPLGMERSTYCQPLPESLQSEAAHAHDRDRVPLPGGWHVYPEMAAAGLWTTPSDLARFAIALNRAASSEGSILSQELASEMLSPQVAASNGLGIFLRNGGAMFEHGGSNMGFRCQMFCLRSSTTGAVIMTNSDSGSELIQELMDALEQVYGWAKTE